MIAAAPWRVAIITFIPKVAEIYAEVVSSLGHQPVVVITPRGRGAGLGPHPFAAEFVADVPAGRGIL